jgi:Cdc6-like AAA superfamily ATPase
MTVIPEHGRFNAGDRQGFAALTNMHLGLRTYLDCEASGPGDPRIGLLYGNSGYGKSVSMAFTAQKNGAAYVEAKKVWTQRSLLEAIAREIGIIALERTSARIFGQVVDQLNSEARGLILDEVDYLVSKSYVEIIRDIHDATSIPIILVGEEALPAKLKAWERFDNRILVATPAQPATTADAKKLRDLYCPRVEIADDLVERIVAVCRGVTRRIVTNLKTAERQAAEAGADKIDLKWWGDRDFRTGDIPVRRLAA